MPPAAGRVNSHTTYTLLLTAFGCAVIVSVALRPTSESRARDAHPSLRCELGLRSEYEMQSDALPVAFVPIPRLMSIGRVTLLNWKNRVVLPLPPPSVTPDDTATSTASRAGSLHAMARIAPTMPPKICP